MPAYSVTLVGKDGKPIETEEIGELHINGPGLLDAYLAPWRPVRLLLKQYGYPTGDFARIDKDGYIFLAGRGKNRLQINGIQFFCEEVETILNTLPGIEESRVFFDSKSQTLSAEVVGSPGATERLSECFSEDRPTEGSETLSRRRKPSAHSKRKTAPNVGDQFEFLAFCVRVDASHRYTRTWAKTEKETPNSTVSPMSIVVQKYGGSSVADAQKLKKVAERVMRTSASGHAVVVVVSAMGDTTDDLLALAKTISPNPDRRELDMLLSAGERISMALLSMAIRELGGDAISFTGSQSGIITNDRHVDARIIEVRPFRVQDELARGKIVVVAGYQGVSYRREITTLGRGGSDTTAVAMAAALGAEWCEICSDVDGVYTADPRVVSEARRIPVLSYEESQELAESGAKVLNAQAVEFAKGKRNFDIRQSYNGSIACRGSVRRRHRGSQVWPAPARFCRRDSERKGGI